MLNFGNENEGPNSRTFVNWMQSVLASPSNTGKAISIKARIKGTSISNLMKAALYDSSKSFVDGTIEYSTLGDNVPTWFTFEFSDGPYVYSGESYYIVIWASGGNNSVSYDLTGDRYQQSRTYGDWPSTINPTLGSGSGESNIYCTYDETDLPVKPVGYSIIPIMVAMGMLK